MDHIKIVNDFLDRWPGLKEAIYKVLTGTGGKKGCIVLQGPPSTGKTIIVKLMASLFEKEDIGCFRRNDDSRFWLTSVVGKKFWIGEEMCFTDEQADIFKQISDGSEYVQSELKNKNKSVYVQRAPMILTSNHPITVMCPRHTSSVFERIFRFMFVKRIAEDDPINFVHTCERHDLRAIMMCIFDFKDLLCCDVKRLALEEFCEYEI